MGAGEYLVFNESDFNPTPSVPSPSDFALNGSAGEEVYLTRPDENGNPEFVDAVDFGGSFDGQTIGRVPNGTGRLTPLSANTLGVTNSDASFGPLVISEVHYHPADPTAEELAFDPTLTTSDFEFIEIHNPTLATVDLTNWRLRGEADFDFATGATLEPNLTLIVVSFDPEDLANENRLIAFTNRFGLTPGMVFNSLVGGYSGRLNNSFGRVELQQPDAAPLDDPTFIPHVTADEVLYDDLAPWPVAADGDGSSLNRIAASAYGNAASSWEAATPTAGISDLGVAAPQVVNTIRDNGSISRPDLWTTFSAEFSGDVNVDLAALSLVNDTAGGVLVDLSGITINNDRSTSTVTWDLSGLATPLEAAFYSVTLDSNLIGGVIDGARLDGDSDGSAGGDFATDAYVAIPGDANLDGDVEVNEINLFLGTNTGDGATVLSNLGSAGTFSWSQGDFNGDGDVDSSQLNLFTGEQNGDYAVFLANLGRNVRPVSSQPVTFQSVVSQPVVVAQPLISQPVTVSPVAEPVSAAVQLITSVADPINLSTSVKPTSFTSEVLTSFEPADETELFGAQAVVDLLNDDFKKPASSVAANGPLVAVTISSLELEGAHELLDGIFSEDIGDDRYDVSIDADEAVIGGLAGALEELFV